MKMSRVLAVLVACYAACLVALVGCSSIDEPPGEYRLCCPDKKTVQPNCPEDSCDAYKLTGEAQSALSLSAAAVYTITDDNAPASPANCNNPAVNSWCECGTDFTDNAPRCNEAGATLLFSFPAVGCEVASASLTYQATAWGGASTVAVHRILRPVVDPPMGVAGLCASSAVASWFRSGPEAWTLPGAAGSGTDRSTLSATKLLASGGLRTETIDVTALVNGCASGQPCVLAQFSPVHVFVYPGTAALVYECAGPPVVCGDGLVEGAEGCDDGNNDAGDGCGPGCAVESGFLCEDEPSMCATSCGDGIVAGTEQCDDGNAASGDGCSMACLTETCTCQ